MMRIRLVLSVALTLWLTLGAPVALPQTLPAKPEGGKKKGFPVSTFALEGLVQKPANLLDLEGKTLRYIPQPNGAYKVETLSSATMVDCETQQVVTGVANPFGFHSWRVAFPFEFAFGGKNWDAVHVNANGNMTFDRPESALWLERHPWPDAGMRSVAAALDSRAMAGQEKTIAVLWAPIDLLKSKVFTKVEKDRLCVTWQARRIQWAHAIAGECVFQVRLLRSGVIEMAYSRLPERDGIVGLFTGQPLKEERLHLWEHKGKAAHASVDIDNAVIDDLGSVLKCTLTLREDVPKKTDGSRLDYRCFVKNGENVQQVNVSVTDAPRADFGVEAAPRTFAFKVQGKVVEMYYSRVLLHGAKKFDVEWDAVWWGKPDRYVTSVNQHFSVEVPKRATGEVDLTATHPQLNGNFFEVFHYPLVSRNPHSLLKQIYQKIPPRDDIALVFTDFRHDDLFATGGGAYPINHVIKGIGKQAETPHSTEAIGSKRLQISIATIWVGSPNFAETGLEGDMEWFNYARGVNWIAHECVHRWGMTLSFRNPKTMKNETLHDDQLHWKEGLHAPGLIPVADRYIERATIGHSIMSGSAWRENPDGTFSKSSHPFGIPGGLSALDLYAMGLLPPEQVPDTFYLTDLKDQGGNRYQAKKVPVRIEDIITAMGPRVPGHKESLKEWRMAVYLVHEPGRAVNADMLTRTKRLNGAVVDFLTRASGNRMKIVPSQP